MSTVRRVQRGSYFTSRTLGDYSAARRGPAVLGKRLARRSLTRQLFRLIRF